MGTGRDARTADALGWTAAAVHVGATRAIDAVQRVFTLAAGHDPVRRAVAVARGVPVVVVELAPA